MATQGSRVIGFQRSQFPTFSNVLLHVNGAMLRPEKSVQDHHNGGAALLIFNQNDETLRFL